MGLFNQWKGVKIGWFHAGTFKSKKTNCKACVFTRRRFFLLQFKVVFLPGSTKSIPNVGKWCFSQLSFDLPVLSPLFAYLNKDRSPSITLWYSFVSILKRQVVFVFICLKISTFLFADTYSLQSKGNCMALKSTTSAKSLHDKQIKQTLTWGFDSETAPWKYCICVVCSWYYIAIVFNFSCQNPFLTNVKDILIHMCILFLLFWWFLRGYFKHYICLSRSKPTYIKDYVNSM